MIKPIVHAWALFKRAGRQHQGNHRFFCKLHKKILNGSHCYVCFNFKLKGTNFPSRPLCKDKNGIVPPTDWRRRVRMTKKMFRRLVKKYRINVRKLLRSKKKLSILMRKRQKA